MEEESEQDYEHSVDISEIKGDIQMDIRLVFEGSWKKSCTF